MKNGEIYTIEGSDEENESVNQSIRDIQQNPLLTQEQRRTKVEAEITKYMIQNRREGISKVSNVMSGIRELGIEFNKEVDLQGDKLANVVQDMEDANANTKKGVGELNKYADTMKGKGTKMIICLVVLILVLMFLLYLIFK
mmetsp:Transcript_1061/g.1055  ORF Transcript_1061/g.1055 Transcript_1061/m.1055 type:complete len:141 (+) Transcript_1061:458-880(+)|eukprot:CAMPEP_0196997512 /NCGR_PEP_ID=MMETSP1380-20130617/3104_1 /TAXON_ID=5936 /ORGANISM="Euplotes crassus, Strain CT5" /LENGTH=140 /DNA_ID=CAMNT_0042413759 /DNA_START=458 /DNA_END=880 /DNA_ORIENTATION=+